MEEVAGNQQKTGGNVEDDGTGLLGGEDGTGGEATGGEMKEKPPKEHPEGMMGGDTDAEKHKGSM